MPASSCCPAPAELDAFRCDSLAPEKEAAVAEHLGACAACRDFLDAHTASNSFAAGIKPSTDLNAPFHEPALMQALARLARLPAASSEQTTGIGVDPQTNEDTTQHTHDIATGSEEGRLEANEAGLLSASNDPTSLGRVDHYEVLRLVGRGGMGFVLKAKDPSLSRIVAIKFLAPLLAADATARRRFEREARAAAAVCHEHVVSIHSVAQANGSPYLVMQYVAGQSLQHKLDRSGPLELKEVLRIGMQTAAGLSAAHAQGLVHRDIKPSNILLENSVERVKIVDFGLARSLDDLTLSEKGVVAGTPSYMSPEQAQGEPVDERSDLFSLGSVLYAMCTGRAPFKAESAMAILRKVADKDPQPIRQINPEIPPWLEAITARLMSKNPSDRFQTASAVADELARRLAELQLPGVMPDSDTTRIEPKRNSTNNQRIMIASVLVSIAVVATAIVLYRYGRTEIRERPAEPPTKIESKSPGKSEPMAALDQAVKSRPSDKFAYLERARARAQRKQFAEAIADLDKAIALDSQFYNAYIDRGWYYRDMNKMPQAIEDFTVAMRLNPGHSWPVYSRGMLSNDLGEWDKAIADFERTIALDPRSDGAYANLGKAFRAKGDLNRSLEYGEKSIAINPTNPWNYLERGLTHRARKEWDLAIRDFQAVERLSAISSDRGLAEIGLNNLGALYLEKGDLPKAIASLSETIKRNDKNLNAHGMRSKAYLASKDWSNALRDLDRAIELQPAVAGRYGDRGWFWKQKGDYHSAIVDYTKALELQPNTFGFHQLRGDAHYRLGHWKEALADFETIVRLNPNDGWARVDRGVARRATGNLAGSLADLDEGVRLLPGTGFIHSERGFTHQALKQWKPAIADLDRAIAQGYRTREVYEALAACRSEIGDVKGANDDAERAARLGSPVAH
jgi:serine/threonine protein kinase/lipoprotein NlpI